ncbi:MAG: lipid II:glycine glycyltransferase FemX [Paracoccaceae bacterium]
MDILWNRTARKTWEALSAPGHAMQQNWAYGEACRALGSSVLRAEIHRAGRPVGVMQIIHRRLFGLLHAAVGTRGPVWTASLEPAEMTAALRAMAKSLPLPSLRGLFLTPDTDRADPLAEARFRRVMTPYATVMLDLKRPPEGLRAALHQKWRNRLAAAERTGLLIRRIDRQPKLYSWLLEAEIAQQRRLKYRALPPALVPAWQAAGGDLRVYTAEKDGQTVGAMLFLIHGKTATYHIGWSNDQGRAASAHNLLLWTAMRKLPRLGIECLDLGGLNTDDSPGVARFKLGTGGSVKSLCGTWFRA